jgi:membrane protein DedA with SNARE-associated domain
MDKDAGWALFLAALIPPPFPFTAVVMTASSLQYSRKRLLWLVFAGRLLRFTLIAILAIYFGQRLLALAESRAVAYFVYALIAIAVVGSTLSIIKWFRK